MNETVAFFHNIGDLGTEESFAKYKLHADACSLAGFDKTFPSIQFVLTEKQQLDKCLLPALYVPIHACGNDLGIVDNQHISLAKIIKDVIEMAVRDALLLSIEHHQARGISLFHRVLRNELLRKVIIKIRRAQIGFGQRILNSVSHKNPKILLL